MFPIRRVAYRIGQFARAVRASFRPMQADDWSEVRRWLPESAVSLFAELPRSDQRHSLNVLHRLQEQASCEASLMQAALLHDCAKHREGIRLWHRVAAVLLRATASDWLDRVSNSDPSRLSTWVRPLWALAHHAQIGADLAETAGCMPEAVELIRQHQVDISNVTDPENRRLLRLLRAADDTN